MRVYINLLMFDEKLAGTGYFTRRLLRQLQNLDTVSEYILLTSARIHDPFTLFEIKSPNFRIHKFSMVNGILMRILVEQLILPFCVSRCIFYSPSVSLPILPMFKVKKVTTIHDLIPFVFPKKYPFFQRHYFNIISRLAAQVSSKVITVSQNSKNDIIRFLKIPDHKIVIVHNFVECPVPEDYNHEVREDYFITVSTIQPGKNLESIIECFQKFIQHTDKSTKLLVIGRHGWGYQNILNLVSQLGLDDQVIFTGYTEEEKLIDYYRKARGLVYLSFYEGFGIPPLEALSYGCPVLVSNNSSLPEVAGKAGIYANPYDKESIFQGFLKLADNNYIKDLSKNFGNEVTKFSPMKEISKLVACFRQLNHSNEI